ncbi:hypothetical protein PG993_005573 [Apiospora rasikravindrae]|uniref:Mid2 domain-containing protein n=1 Tax=Apiospora rasikravindrae TaxID=990691 RepID=A0ABR1TFY6_9PEZI
MIGLFFVVNVIGAGLVWCQQQQQPLVADIFFNPDSSVLPAASDFSANPVWTVGEVQKIRWATTYTDYTISLWQHNTESGSALQGPTIFQSRAAISFTQYDWVPQIFDFDLSESNVFFLRLRPGTGATANPGAPEPQSMRSCYFNISIVPSSSSSSSPPTLPPLVLPRAATATEVDETIPTIPPSYTALTLDTAPAPPSRVPSQNAAPHATYIISGASSSPATPEPLSTGAKIGIGVGAGVGGVVLVTVGVLLTFRRARKRDSTMRLSTLKDLPTLPRVVGGGLESPQFYQLKEDYPSTISTKGHHRQVMISETRLGCYPRVAELG